MKNRLHYLDNLKAILIILVIIGHAIQGSIDNYQHNLFFRLIYSFHMPLFLSISGYFTYKPKYDSLLISKRFIQLLVPFVIWAFISPLLLTGSFNSYATLKALLYPDNGLWFLYNIFVYSTLFNISEKMSDKYIIKQEVIICVFSFILFGAMATFKTKFNCTQLCWYFPFFAIGYYIRKYSYFVKIRRNVIVFCTGGIYYWNAVLDDARRSCIL